jgi:predicted nucleic acid-binding protein
MPFSNHEPPTHGVKSETRPRYAVSRYVLDSFALTAYVENEPGRLRVSAVLEEARTGGSRVMMTTINLGETLYTMERRQGYGGVVQILNLVPALRIDVIDADLKLAVAAARIKAVTPISYGDCYAAALALEEDATLLTGDPEFQRLENVIRIEWLPQR